MTGEEDDDEEEDDSTIKMGTLDSLFYATTNPQEEDKEAEIRRRVSSYHLSLASPVLSTQLCRPPPQMRRSSTTLFGVVALNFRKTCNAISQQRVPNVAVWLLGISLEKEFSHCAQLLLSDYEGPGTDTLHDIPLTEVLYKFDGMRITLIKKVFTALENLEQTLSTEHDCPEAGLEQCTAMALGVLIRGKRMFQNIEE
ncbi:hypothetical protein H9L39_01962 [Fusarium oxysporum f. sp. albedinis]|nr:hypothetical protein H9L39_01962 [Fusarium oxysporum f. sp. albedinis]